MLCSTLSFSFDISSSLRVLIHKEVCHHQWALAFPMSNYHTPITRRKILATLDRLIQRIVLSLDFLINLTLGMVSHYDQGNVQF